MKKAFCLILALLLIFSLCACNKEDSTPKTDPATKAIVGTWSTASGLNITFHKDGTGIAPIEGSFMWRFDTTAQWYFLSYEGLTFTFTIQEENGKRFILLEGERFYYGGIDIDNNNSDTNNDDDNNSSDNSDVNQDPLVFLYGQWCTYNKVYRFTLYADGKGADVWEQETAWTLENNILSIERKGAAVPGSVAGDFQVVQANGFYYLILDSYTFVRADMVDSIPVTQVELTTENCMEYLEIVEVSTEIKDSFGEPTGKYNTYMYLSVKNPHRYTRTGQIVVRYLNEVEYEVTITEGNYRVLLHSKPYSATKVQGTLYLLDGI